MIQHLLLLIDLESWRENNQEGLAVQKIRIGFIGSGYMGQRAHIANYATLPDVELTALAEGRRETAKAVAQRYGIRTTYSNHKEMLEKAKLDAVVAIMHFSLHHAVVPDILEKGLPLLTEKPICVSLKTGEKFLKQVEENDTIYQVGYMKRCDPATRFVKETIAQWKQSKEFGSLNYLRVTMPPGDWIFEMDPPINMGDKASYDNETPEKSPGWMTKEQARAYMDFINYYIHQVNLIRYLLNEDYSVEYVNSSGKILVAKSNSGVSIVLEMATYQVVNEWHEFYESFFDKGKIKLSLPAPLTRQRAGEVEIYKNKGKNSLYQKPVIVQKWSMLEQASFFIDAVRNKKRSISPASDAVKDLQIAEVYVKKLFAG